MTFNPISKSLCLPPQPRGSVDTLVSERIRNDRFSYREYCFENCLPLDTYLKSTRGFFRAIAQNGCISLWDLRTVPIRQLWKYSDPDLNTSVEWRIHLSDNGDVVFRSGNTPYKLLHQGKLVPCELDGSSFALAKHLILVEHIERLHVIIKDIATGETLNQHECDMPFFSNRIHETSRHFCMTSYQSALVYNYFENHFKFITFEEGARKSSISDDYLFITVGKKTIKQIDLNSEIIKNEFSVSTYIKSIHCTEENLLITSANIIYVYAIKRFRMLAVVNIDINITMFLPLNDSVSLIRNNLIVFGDNCRHVYDIQTNTKLQSVTYKQIPQSYRDGILVFDEIIGDTTMLYIENFNATDPTCNSGVRKDDSNI